MHNYQNKGVSLSNKLFYYVWSSFDWLFPPSCGGCDNPGTRWCSQCQYDTTIIHAPVCRQCGLSLKEIGTCRRCFENPSKLTGLRSWAEYGGPIRTLIHNLKYHHNMGLAIIFSLPLTQLIHQTGWQVDMVIPVPLAEKRLKERGFNQAALLARPVASGLKTRYSTTALIRSRETKSQVELNFVQRKKNVKGAFSSYSPSISGKNVLLVDDVTTSGSTLDACATALIKNGAKRVYGLTLSRTVYSNL